MTLPDSSLSENLERQLVDERLKMTDGSVEQESLKDENRRLVIESLA
jgi:hypothetical protein